MLWWTFIFLINVDLHLYCSAEKDSSSTIFGHYRQWDSSVWAQCTVRVLVVHTALQSKPKLCPIPCDTPLYYNSHGEACVCVWVKENVCLWIMCVWEIWGESRALYIMEKECMSVDWSVDESSKVEGQS